MTIMEYLQTDGVTDFPFGHRHHRRFFSFGTAMERCPLRHLCGGCGLLHVPAMVTFQIKLNRPLYADYTLRLEE